MKATPPSDELAQDSYSERNTPPSFLFRPVRTRMLVELEDDALRPKLISIVAPIGYGKTVLMSELYSHLRQSGEHCYWVSLDERHASLERLLYSMRTVHKGLRTELDPTQALLQSDATTDAHINALIELIASFPFSVTIFLDNLNSCTDAALGAFLDALIFRTPPSVRFVWTSTTELTINTGRAKLEHLVRCIGLSELSLTIGEVRELLGTKVEHLIGKEGVEAILRQTEGWPAAIRMVQIILAESDGPAEALQSFSGSDEDIAALLKRQILSGFTPELHDFLLRLSLLRTFSPGLCRQATGDDRAEAHIDSLLKRNVFMIPLDRNRKQYRLHGLFREFLLSEAERLLDSDERSRVLERAADWCEKNEYWTDAINYAMAAGALPKAKHVLDRIAKLFVREHGNIKQFIAWVEFLLERGGAIGWETHYWYVWALFFQRRYEYGLKQHELLKERIQHPRSDDSPPKDLSQRIAHLRICIDIFTDRVTDAHRGTETWLAANTNHNPYGTGSVCCIQSYCLASSFKFAAAQQVVRIAQPIVLEIGSIDMIAWINLLYGMIHTFQGDYLLAHEDFTKGITLAKSKQRKETVLSGAMACIAAKCAVEMGLDQQGLAFLETGRKTVNDNTLVDTVVSGLDAAVKIWRGGNDKAISIPYLRKVASSYPPRVSLMFSCYLIQRLLRLGCLQEALDEAEQIDLLPRHGEICEPRTREMESSRYRDLVSATAIDLYIATGRYKRADALIEREYRIAKDDGRSGRLVELGLAQAATALHAGNPAAAAKALTGAISRAARRRIIRPFIDWKEIVATVIDDGKVSSWSFVVAEERQFYEDICGKVKPREPSPKTPTGKPTSGDTPPLAPTAREAELLALLDMGLSNQEIADRTEVSITTIKWHLKNLYKKFGVSNRTAALSRARALTWIAKP